MNVKVLKYKGTKFHPKEIKKERLFLVSPLEGRIAPALTSCSCPSWRSP